MEQSDEEIAYLVQQGNKEIFGEIIVRYEKKLKRYGERFLSSRDDIDDIVQDTFIKAYLHIKSFKTSARLSPWIYRIAHNAFANELRRRSRFAFIPFEFEGDTLFPTLIASDRSDDYALSKEQVEMMDSVLQKLSPKEREIIHLAIFEEMTYETIADILHIPIGTVGVRLYRAKQKIKQEIKTI